MSNYAEEAADLAKLGGALVINMGTVTPEGLKNYVQALQAYNAAGRPVVFDPVGYVSSHQKSIFPLSPRWEILTTTPVPAQPPSAAPQSRPSSPPATSPSSKATKASSRPYTACP
jgi:hypothetical protein